MTGPRPSTRGAAIAALLAVLAIAAIPYQEYDSGSYASTGGVWCQAVVTDANSTTYLVPYSDAAATPALFGWGTQVRISARAVEGVACFVGAREATLGSQVTTAAAKVTDASGPNGTGPGACAPFSMGDNPIEVVKLRNLQLRAGYRSGVCSTAATGVTIDVAVRPPCDADADCAAEGSSGTCVTAPTSAQQQASGAMLILRAKQAGEVVVCVRR